MRKKLSFEVQFLQHSHPMFAIGFIRWQEFMLALWLVDFRIKWGY